MSLAGSFATESHLCERAPDTASEHLVAQLALNDIAAVQATRKGKARETAPRSDEEIALNLQATSLNAFIGVLNDYQLASSIDSALESDVRQLRRFTLAEQAEQDDHRAAIALRDGHDFPQQTLSQWLMEQTLIQPASERSATSRTSSITGADMQAISGGMSHVHISTPGTFKFTPREPQKIECLICKEAVVARRSFQAPCRHHYCQDCLVNLVQTSLRDETLHPLRCCQTPLPLESGVFKFISITVQLQFLAKHREYSTPAGERVYCSNPRCSAFLGASGNTKRDLICSSCDTTSCSQCKNNTHPGENCSEHQSALQVQEMAVEKKWQRCPGCRAIVELSHGCYHITCRCSAQFCYLCASHWKTCDCRQWDEDQLLNDAERRVRNQFGDRAARAQPAVYAERVCQRMEVLRENHECEAHLWRHRYGPGRCEECGDSLPVYLMRCTHCQALVCRRCSVNRL